MKRAMFLFCYLMYNFSFAIDLHGTWRKESPVLDQDYVAHVGEYLIFDAKNVNQVDRWGMENYQRHYAYEIIKTNSGYDGFKVHKANDFTNYDIWRFELGNNKLQVCFYVDGYHDCYNYFKTSDNFELRSGNHNTPNAKIIITTCVNSNCQDQDLDDGIIIRNTYNLISKVGGPSFPKNEQGPNCGTQFWGGLVKPNEMDVESYLAGMNIICRKSSMVEPWEVVLTPKAFFLSGTTATEFEAQYKGNKLLVRISLRPLH